MRGEATREAARAQAAGRTTKRNPARTSPAVVLPCHWLTERYGRDAGRSQPHAAALGPFRHNWLIAALVHCKNMLQCTKTALYERTFPHCEETLMPNTETKTRAAAKAAGDTTEKTASAAKSAAKDMADAAFAYPRLEVPEVFRSFAEQGLTQTREAYARIKAATEEATDLIEESFETTRDGVREAQFKALDAAQANA